MRIRNLAIAGTLALAGLGTGLATAGTASAAGEPCTSGYACLYYNSDYKGAFYRQYFNIPNYASYYFSASAAGSNGAGIAVKNNTASVDNWDFYNGIRLYFNSSYLGASQSIGAGGAANLNTTLKNDNASGKFY
ncbi:peptidase inhibitor family I36 protein [Streptomyces sp. NPDC093064]|uniref:peptidase inhibitor family I36 protein n=1 Tax=unclassified Streptomyces TaxID=2593676 RepID=UPI0035D629F9